MIKRFFQVIVIQMLLVLCIALFVLAEDIRRAFFVLKDDQAQLSMGDVVLQDKPLSDCTKRKECKFFTKHTTKGKMIFFKWNGVTIPKMVGRGGMVWVRVTILNNIDILVCYIENGHAKELVKDREEGTSILQDLKDDFAGTENTPGFTRSKLSDVCCRKRTLRNGHCLNLRETGQTESRVFPIIINGIREQIPCDMTTEGGGWTIFQRRVDGEVDFYRNWSDYKIGFGDRKKNFWLGLDLIHTMVSQGESELRVDLTNYKGQSAYSKYERFYVGNESEGYKLTVSGYSGTAGDAMTYHNGMKFTTKDRDNDKRNENCAIRYKGAFWYFQCYLANPNGLYPKERETGVTFIKWNTLKSDVMFIEMKFRRKL